MPFEIHKISKPDSSGIRVLTLPDISEVVSIGLFSFYYMPFLYNGVYFLIKGAHSF